MSSKKSKQLVNEATKDNRQPPSGFILQELAKRTSSIAECETIEELVVKKLQKNKPYVKYKALRIIKYLCENGSSTWRRAWQRQTDKLRECQQYRGAPDPIYGDAPFESVRKAAKEAMTSVFQSTNNNAHQLKTRIQGTGGGGIYESSSTDNQWNSTKMSSFSSGVKGVFSLGKNKSNTNVNNVPSFGGSNMVGFGNDPSYKPQEKRIGPFQPLEKNTYDASKFANENKHAQNQLNTTTSRGNKKRKKGTVGGAWGDDSNNNNINNNNNNTNSYGDKFVDYEDSDDEYKPRSINRKAMGGNISIKSDGTYERKWLSDIVTSGGIGAKIPQLNKYVRQFDNLSKSHVLEFLDIILEEDETWQKTVKALALIIGLLDGNSSNDVIEYFKESPDNLMELENHNKAAIRKRVKTIIETVGLDEEDENDDDENNEDNGGNYNNDDNNNQATADDLLDIGNDNDGDDLLNMVSNEQQNNNNNNNNNDNDNDDGAGDMFGGLNVDDNTNTNNNNDNVADLMNMNTTQNTKNNNNNDDDGGLMDLMNMGNDNNNNVNNNNNTNSSAFDFMNNGSGNNNNVTNNKQSASSAFDFMNNNNNTTNTQQQSNKQQTKSSPFDFMNDNNNQTTTTQNTNTNNQSSSFAFMNNKQPTTSSTQQSTNNKSDAFSFMNTSNTKPTQPTITQQKQSSSFSFLNNNNPTTQQSTINQQTSNQSSSFSFMNNQNTNTQQTQPSMNMNMNMNNFGITNPLMQTNQQNMAQMNSLIQQMNQLKMMQQMQQSNISSSNYPNLQQMNINPMIQQLQRNMNNFSQQMNQVNATQHQFQHNQYQTNNPNDIFASAMQPQQTQQIKPKKPEKDPFADLGLGNF